LPILWSLAALLFRRQSCRQGAGACGPNPGDFPWVIGKAEVAQQEGNVPFLNDWLPTFVEKLKLDRRRKKRLAWANLRCVHEQNVDSRVAPSGDFVGLASDGPDRVVLESFDFRPDFRHYILNESPSLKPVGFFRIGFVSFITEPEELGLGMLCVHDMSSC